MPDDRPPAAPTPLAPPGARYRFQDVEVDPARQVLTVGGREVTCQPLVFQLLLILCAARGAVVARDDLFGRLWPDQAFRSDESLTQVVHRLRAALGPAGALVRTVRGAGFRLDGGVIHLGDEPPPAPIATGAAAPHRTAWRRARPLLVLLAAASAAAVWISVVRPSQVIDSGFGLERADLRPAREQTVDLVTRALAAEHGGDRAQARHLLEIAHATDASTPVPAIFRCLFSYWQDPRSDAAAWAQAAAARLHPGAAPYLHLLVRYAAATAAGRGADGLAASSALLAIRPSAWYLRLARAHYHLAQREDAAALADLRQIPVLALNGFSAALVLADRAALGDVAGAERDLAASRLQGQDALLWYVRARIAWSRRRDRDAVAAWDRELDTALRHNQPDLVPDARLLGGVAACDAGDLAAAASRFDLAAAEAGEPHLLDTKATALGLGAYLAWRRGDLPGRDRRLAEAAAVHADPDLAFRLALALLALWTGAPPPEDPAALAAVLPDIPELTGARPLLLGRAAAAAGNPIQARRLLLQSRTEGIAKTYFLEEAALLAADLGEPTAPLRVDPPYPNLLRFAAAAELARRQPAAAPAAVPARRQPAANPTAVPTSTSRSRRDR